MTTNKSPANENPNGADPTPRTVDLTNTAAPHPEGALTPMPAEPEEPQALAPWVAEAQGCEVLEEGGFVYLVSQSESPEVGPGVSILELTFDDAAELAAVLWGTVGNPADVAAEDPPVMPRAREADTAGGTGWASRMGRRARKASTDPGGLKTHLEAGDTDSPVSGVTWGTLIMLVLLGLTFLAVVVSWFM